MFVSDPTVLHADVDAFFAAVEQRDDPHLRGRPVIVGAWVVLAASYEAKADGVRTAMSVARARRLCPRAIVVEPRMSAYTEASRAVYRVFDDTTPLVEGLSIDEAFLDVRGLRRLSGTPTEIAARLRREVRERVGLPITVGVARTKFLATVGEVARVEESVLVSILGRGSGRQLHALAHNRDPRPVQPGRRRGSIGSQCALGRRRRSPDEVDAILLGLVDRVMRRLRKARRVGRTVVLRLRFDDFSRATRSFTLTRATAETRTVVDTAQALFAASMPLIESRGLTLVGVTVANLETDCPWQLELPFERSGGIELDLAVDEIRNRFGLDAITRGVLLGRHTGVTVPLLPD